VAEESTPDIYIDGVIVGSGPYGITIALTRGVPENPTAPPAIVGHLRMGVRLAEVLAPMLLTAVQQAIDAPTPVTTLVPPSPDEAPSN
jgi:hypothetical protein